MADEDIGGYFSALRLIVDQESFDKGHRAIVTLEMKMKQQTDTSRAARNSWTEFTMGLASSLYVIKNVAEALEKMFGAMVKMNEQTAVTGLNAFKSGMTYETYLNQILGVGVIPGVDKNAFGKEMESANKLQQQALTAGKYDQNTATALALNGITNQSEELYKSTSQFIMDIFNSTLKKMRSDPKHAQSYEQRLTDILGPQSSTVASYLYVTGQNYSDLIGKGQSIRATDTGTSKKSLLTATEVNEIQQRIEEFLKLFSVEGLEGLRPILDAINQSLIDNKDSIISGIKDFSTNLTVFSRVMVKVNDVMQQWGVMFNPLSKEGMEFWKKFFTGQLPLVEGMKPLNQMFAPRPILDSSLRGRQDFSVALGSRSPKADKLRAVMSDAYNRMGYNFWTGKLDNPDINSIAAYSIAYTQMQKGQSIGNVQELIKAMQDIAKRNGVNPGDKIVRIYLNGLEKGSGLEDKEKDLLKQAIYNGVDSLIGAGGAR